MSMQIFEKLITDVREHEIRTFKSWLYVLTKNQCLMQLRSRKSQHSREEGYKIEQEFMESESEVHPLDREDRSLEDALNDCIAQLKAEQKACITLFYYEKLCYQEIAEKMVIPEKKVKSYLQNGKRNLKICLEEKHHVRQKSP